MIHTEEEISFLTDLLDRIAERRDAMPVVELDGYVAGLVVCPEWIAPPEWLPRVWGGDSASDDIEEAAVATRSVTAHYLRVDRDLARDPQAYRPILGYDPGRAVLLWEPWVRGFGRAMDLRSDAWLRIEESGDGGAIASVGTIVAMKGIDEAVWDLSDGAVEEIDRTAADVIPACVRALNAWTRPRRWAGGLECADAGRGFRPSAPQLAC